MIFIAVYLAAISVLSIILTIYDKRAARQHKWRVRENTLLLAAVLGGAVAMLLTMRIIRHKTKHAKFMAGLPLVIAIQIAAVALILAKTKFAI